MQENLDTKETLHRLEMKKNALTRQTEISVLNIKQDSYGKILDRAKRHWKEENFFKFGRVPLCNLVFMCLGTISISNISVLGMFGSIVVAGSSLVAVGVCAMITISLCRPTKLRNDLNLILLKLGKEPLDPNVKVTRKTKKNVVSSLTKEREDIRKEIQRLESENQVLTSEIQLYENKLSEDCRKIAASEQKRTPISNLDIRTRNTLLLQEVEPTIDDSNVKPIQFVKRK